MTKLHFTRVRSKGDSSFYDPSTDIRQLLPSIIKTTLVSLQDKYEGTPLMEDFRTLHNFFCVFQIRLAEDPQPCANQIQDFFSAVRQVSAGALHIWLEHMAILLLCVYGLYTRRDIRTDGSVVSAMLDTGRYAALMAGLSEETKQRIKQEVGVSGIEQLTSPGREDIDARGFAVCEETSEVIENIKALASLYLSHTGEGDWNSLAEACDREFQRGDDKPDRANVALALSYPTYKQPCLRVSTNESAESQVE